MRGNGEKKIAEAASMMGFMEIYANDETQAWTLVVITQNNPKACIVLVGDGWESVRDSY